MSEKVLPIIPREQFAEFQRLIVDLPSYDRWQEAIIENFVEADYRIRQQLVTPDDFRAHMKFKGSKPSVRELWLCAENKAGVSAPRWTTRRYNPLER